MSEIFPLIDEVRNVSSEIKKNQKFLYNKILCSIEMLRKNHHIFLKNLFIHIMKDSKVKNFKFSRIRSASVNKIHFSHKCFDSKRNIRFDDGQIKILKFYKSFFSNLNIIELYAYLIQVYLEAFEELESLSKIKGTNSFTIEEFVHYCRLYNVYELFSDWEVFSTVSNINISKSEFEKEVQIIKNNNLVKKTLRVLKK